MRGIENLKISEDLYTALETTGIEEKIRSVYKELYKQGFHPILIEHVLACEVQCSGAEFRLMEASKQYKTSHRVIGE